MKIIAPKNIIFHNLKYKNIEVINAGILEGHLWEQIELPILVRKYSGKLLNLCNTAPIISPGIVTIHDIQTKVHPEFFSKKFALWYNFINKLNIKRSRKIITVSKFSKNEIVKYYGISENKIEVIYNGWQHMERVVADEKILDKLNLRNKEYILGVSSLNPNKNFKYILELAKIHPEYQFIIVGKKNIKVFSEYNIENIDNLKWAGYVTDEELKTLYSKAKVFVFPSIYEGFGIPPLEALACGCENILVSNTSCLPEIYKNNAEYFNPYKIFRIEKTLNKKVKNILLIYNWKNSAKKIEDCFI